MEEKIIEIKKQALDKIKEIKDSKNLEDIRIHFLGKKGELTSLLKMLGDLPKEERPKFGEKVNKAKNEIIFILVFIVYILIIVLFNNVYFSVSGWNVSIFLLLGFFILIFGLFLFINLNQRGATETSYDFCFISEDIIKFILFFLLSFFNSDLT